MMLWIVLDNSKKQFQIDWYSPLQGIDFSAHSKRKIYIYKAFYEAKCKWCRPQVKLKIIELRGHLTKIKLNHLKTYQDAVSTGNA